MTVEERRRYHVFRSMVWMVRAGLATLVALYVAFFWFAAETRAWLFPVIAGLAAVCVGASFIHQQLEHACTDENSCGDDHNLG